MHDYMATLYQQFFRGPDFTELEEDIEQELELTGKEASRNGEETCQW